MRSLLYTALALAGLLYFFRPRPVSYDALCFLPPGRMVAFRDIRITPPPTHLLKRGGEQALDLFVAPGCVVQLHEEAK